MTRSTPTAIVVLHAFGQYSRGDLITDPLSVRAIMDGGNSNRILIPVLPSELEVPAAVSSMTEN